MSRFLLACHHALGWPVNRKPMGQLFTVVQAISSCSVCEWSALVCGIVALSHLVLHVSCGPAVSSPVCS